MTRWYEFGLAVALVVAIWWLALSLGRLILFYWRRWRVRREYAALCRISFEAIARMERKP